MYPKRSELKIWGVFEGVNVSQIARILDLGCEGLKISQIADFRGDDGENLSNGAYF